jgi:hypothetical protein
LRAIVLLRQTLRKLLGHLPNPELRLTVGQVLAETSHVLADIRPATFGWAVRRTGAAGLKAGPWSLEFDAAHALYCTDARDETGQPIFEVIGLAALPTPELPAPLATAAPCTPTLEGTC